jgi:hypothetical protein
LDWIVISLCQIIIFSSGGFTLSNNPVYNRFRI